MRCFILLPCCTFWNLCRQFGAKVVPHQPILKAVPSLFESKDGKARDKVKELVVGNLLRQDVNASMSTIEGCSCV